MHLSCTFIQNVLPQAHISGPELPQNVSFSFDSRAFIAGQCFIALSGARVDGHDFIEQVLEQGACGCVVSQKYMRSVSADLRSRLECITVVAVTDTYKALLALAHAWRMQFSIPCVGVTGSVGKTSTKELLARMFKMAGKRVLVSPGNRNTPLGCSLAMLSMRKHHDIAIFEMGVSRAGDMRELADLVRPTIALITTIGHSHMAGLGSFADIAREKRAIFSHFAYDNIGVINGDISVLSSVAYQHPIIKFGRRMTNQVQARKVVVHGGGLRFILSIYGKKHSISLPTPHEGTVTNILAACSVAHYLGVEHSAIVAAIEKSSSVPGRFESHMLSVGHGLVVDDCYNASPESMKEALVAFDKIDVKGVKIAVLGDMLELGVHASFWHRQLGRILHKVPSIEQVVFVGKHGVCVEKTAPLGMTVVSVDSWQKARDIVRERLEGGAAVLVKASRGVGLDRLVEALTV